MKLKCRRTMQNVCLVTMWEVWTVETNNGLVYRPHPQFLAQNLSKKVRLIFQLQSLVFDPLIIKENFILQVLATVKHEIFHALGFAPSLYAFFRNQSGEPLTARRSNGLPKEYDDVLKHYKWSEQVRLLAHYIEEFLLFQTQGSCLST